MGNKVFYILSQVINREGKIADLDLNGRVLAREAGRVEYPPGGGGTVYNRFDSPFLFPTIEDDGDDDSDQTQNSKKNAENYQRVLAGWS